MSKEYCKMVIPPKVGHRVISEHTEMFNFDRGCPELSEPSKITTTTKLKHLRKFYVLKYLEFVP